MIDKILNNVCLDERITDGIFQMDNNEHMDVLQEHLVKLGLNANDAVECRNRMVEGKYPERQAYNKDGLLVTFPTPEYKQRAIARGTHFEKNPKAAQASAMFQGQPAAQAQTAAQPAAPQPAPKLEPADLAPQPAATEQPLEAPSDEEQDTRTPEEKKQDAQVVQNILSSAPASIDITKNYPNLEENQILEYKGKWYNNKGEYIGKKWVCETTGKTFISK